MDNNTDKLNENDILLESTKKSTSNVDSDLHVKVTQVDQTSSRSRCISIITLGVFVVIGLILLATSIYLILTMPKIHKQIEPLPRRAHLCLIDIDKFLNADSTYVAKMEYIQNNLKMFSKNGIHSIAIYIPNLFIDENNLNGEVVDQFKKLVTYSTANGVNVGIILNSEYIKTDERSKLLADLPVISFYHIANGEKPNYDQIIKFDDYLNKTSFLSLKRSNNIIYETVKALEVLDESKHSLKVSSDLRPYDESNEPLTYTMFDYPRELFSTVFWAHKDVDIPTAENFDQHFLKMIKYAFYSYGAVFIEGYDLVFRNVTDNTEKTALDKKYEKVLSFARNFFIIKAKTKFWSNGDYNIEKFVESSVSVYAIDHSVSIDKGSVYDYVVLLQNPSSTTNATIDLKKNDHFSKHSVGHMMYSSNVDINPSETIRVNISRVTLGPFESLILATYLPSAVLKNVAPEWPTQ